MINAYRILVGMNALGILSLIILVIMYQLHFVVMMDALSDEKRSDAMKVLMFSIPAIVSSILFDSLLLWGASLLTHGLCEYLDKHYDILKYIKRLGDK